ncbi:MAG: endonuclease/exonuclease/phosphatase family protein, partial [Thermoanaerobaculia bacterium]
ATAARLLAPAAPPAAVETDGPIRVLTYNLHQGFDVDGRLAPEALAEVIESERPDVVALQEVTRGWLVTGGLDLHSWMVRRLGLAGRFAGTADPQWGNAVLSRLPILASVYHRLPPKDLPLRRGVLDVMVETRRGPLRLLCLHLHHHKPDGAIRVEQIEALLGIWGGSPGTLLLGDFNAEPGSAAIQRLRRAGLHDASALLDPGRRGTTTRLHRRQIDWVFATPDLEFEATAVRYSKASDHLPVATTVRFTPRFTGAAPPTAAREGRTPPG